MLAVTISVDNRRLVARLVPAGTMTEAEVLKLGYKFDFRFFQLKLEALLTIEAAMLVRQRSAELVIAGFVLQVCIPFSNEYN